MSESTEETSVKTEVHEDASGKTRSTSWWMKRFPWFKEIFSVVIGGASLEAIRELIAKWAKTLADHGVQLVPITAVALKPKQT